MAKTRTKTRTVVARVTEDQYEKLVWLAEELETSNGDAVGKMLDSVVLAPVTEVVTAPRVSIVTQRKHSKGRVPA